MNLLGFSHPARWLVLPVTVVALMMAPPAAGLLSLGVFCAMVIVGFCEQGVRLGDLSSRVRWVSYPLAFAVLLGGAAVKVNWLVTDGSSMFVVWFSLSAVSGLLCGAFLASLRSKRVPATGGVPELLARANQATVLRVLPTVPAAAPSELPEPRQVDALIDGRWQRATLDAWETRDLALYGRVSVHDSSTGPQWVSADLLRVVPEGDPTDPQHA